MKLQNKVQITMKKDDN